MSIVSIDVEPAFGWGWVFNGLPRFEVPEPFSINLQSVGDHSCKGIVISVGHEFEGLEILLSQRHVEWSGHVNVEVHPSDSGLEPTTGFATIAYSPW